MGNSCIASRKVPGSNRFITSNVLLRSLPRTYVSKLQRVQNSLARVITRAPKFASSKPLLIRLHWLPVVMGIDFKIACMTYKAVHMNQPPLLSKTIQLRSIKANTRSADHLQLQHPPIGTNNYGRRAFGYAAPSVWNKIPLQIRMAPSILAFRKQLDILFQLLL